MSGQERTGKQALKNGQDFDWRESARAEAGTDSQTASIVQYSVQYATIVHIGLYASSHQDDAIHTSVLKMKMHIWYGSCQMPVTAKMRRHHLNQFIILFPIKSKQY